MIDINQIEPQEIKDRLSSLQSNTGWQLLNQIMSNRIEELKKERNKLPTKAFKFGSEDMIAYGHRLMRLNERIEDMETLMTLPKKYISEFDDEKATKTDEDFDIYE